LVLGIWVEDSPKRTDGIAPGPGGAGYDLERRYGDATHYLRVPSHAAGETLLTGLEGQGRVGRLWGGGTADLWYVQIWAPSEAGAKNEIADLGRLARSRGGHYDGGEVMHGEVFGPQPPA